MQAGRGRKAEKISVCSKDEGLVHKSKTAKGSEVVREGDGVIPSALMG